MEIKNNKEKYRVVKIFSGDPHFAIPSPVELFTSYDYEDCIKFCKTYAQNNPGFYSFEIQKQILAWEKIDCFYSASKRLEELKLPK